MAPAALRLSGRTLIVAALLGATGVALGAWGAHGLQAEPEQVATWRTAVLYHLVHALALLGLSGTVRLSALAAPTSANTLFSSIVVLFVSGTLCFSGSLYLLVLDGPRWLGPVTPLGGVLLIAGWTGLIWMGCRIVQSDKSI